MREKVRLKDIAIHSKGKQINGIDLVENGRYNYLNGGINPSGKWNEFNNEGNTITISEGGNSSGYVNYMVEPFWCGAHCYYLYGVKGNSKYLYYALKSKQEEIMQLRTGTAMPNIKKSTLGEFSFTYDNNVVEQAKVVQILEKTEKIIENLRAQLIELDNLIKSRFVEMFGMPHERRFKTKTLPEIIASDKDALKRGPFGGSLKKDDFISDGYLVYEQRHAIHNDFEYEKYYINEDKYNAMRPFKVVPGDLLVSCSGVTLGRIAEVPIYAKKGIINQALLKITLNQNVMANKYFMELFRNEEIQNHLFGFSRGSGIPNFPSMNEVKEVEFLCPPIELQQKYCDFLRQVDKLKIVVKKSLDETQMLYDSLMQEYFK